MRLLFHRNPQRHRDACLAEERGRSEKAKASFSERRNLERRRRRRRRQRQKEREKKKKASQSLILAFNSPVAARGATLALDAEVTRVPDRHDVEERAACILVRQERARGGKGEERIHSLQKIRWSKREEKTVKKTSFFSRFFSLSLPRPRHAAAREGFSRERMQP